jgi:hypothetical protein
MNVTFRKTDATTYDRRRIWEVLVDGELRGYLMPEPFSREYGLHDLERNALRRKEGGYTIRGRNLEDAKAIADNAAIAGIIPTPAEIAARKAARERAEWEEDARRILAERRQRIADRGLELLSALEDMIAMHEEERREGRLRYAKGSPIDRKVRQYRELAAELRDLPLSEKERAAIAAAGGEVAA